jgi:hypothetical protein
MFCRNLLLIVVCLMAGSLSNAQPGNNYRVSWWPAYSAKVPLNEQWTLNVDLQARNFAKVPLLGLIAFRTGFHYRLKNDWFIGMGVAWFHQQLVKETRERVSTDEPRAWQEIRNERRLKKWMLVNQFRTEQRHWVNQNGIAHRLRYRLAAELSCNKKWKLLFGNEIMWQGSKTRSNWDQYRLWAGTEYDGMKSSALQVILMNWWQFNSNTYQPVVRINFVQSFNMTR